MSLGPRGRVLAAAAVVAVALLAYPLAVLAGGRPRFPGPDECAQAPVPGKKVDVVFGRFGHPGSGQRLLADLQRFGFVDAVLLPDGCGRWEVVVPDRADVPAAEEVAAEARRVDLDPRLERSPR